MFSINNYVIHNFGLLPENALQTDYTYSVYSSISLTCSLMRNITTYCIHVILNSILTAFPHFDQAYHLGDNCIQNFHLGRYIVGYTVGNLVLRRRVSGAVKRDFRTYIRRYTSPNENFEFGYPHSNALLNFSLKKDSENVLCYA